MNTFSFFVAQRYLRARRKEAAISVITVIAVTGVAAGVMALVIALAINNGFRNTLQRVLLGATAHVSVLEKEPVEGIHNWRELSAKLRQLPHVTQAIPALYDTVLYVGPLRQSGGVLKGVPPESAATSVPALKQGSTAGLNQGGKLPGIILGSRLADSTGMRLNSMVTVISPRGEQTPFGPMAKTRRYRVVGIFESGFAELDAAWAYTGLVTAQQMFSTGDVVNDIELKLDDINQAAAVARASDRLTGPTLSATTWMEQQKQLTTAFRMERIVTVITIGLIQLVAALNILITLVLMVMEKYKDIAILAAMGARRGQIRAIFMMQGVLIGVVGTAVGLILGYTLSYLANEYRWVRLDADVYALSFVPFEPRWTDGLAVAAGAILISLVATLYPARNATRISPVEVLRYE